MKCITRFLICTDTSEIAGLDRMDDLLRRYIPWEQGEKIRVVFLFQAGTVWPSTESVYESCLSDTRFDVRLVYDDELAVEKGHMAEARNFLQVHHLPYVFFRDFDWREFNPHVVFIQFPYDTVSHSPQTLSIQFARNGVRVVYVPYGIEITITEQAVSGHFEQFVIENSWRIYTSCEGIKAEYMHHCRNRCAVRVTGSPKFDAIFHRGRMMLNAQIAQARQGRSLVVWKIHFPKKIKENGLVHMVTPYLSEYISFANSIESYDNIYFVVLAHPRMLRKLSPNDIQGDDTLMPQVQELLSVLRGKENVFIDVDDDYRPSLYHADAIMIDRSAVMVEAAMLGVPVLFLRNAEWREPFTKPVEHVVNSFYQGTGVADMREFLTMVQCGEDPERDERKSVIGKEFPFLDGKCGERIKEDIVESIAEPQRMRPRILLYAAGEVCEYYLGVQGWKANDAFEVIGIADGNQARWGEEVYGYKIFSPKKILSMDFDAIVIMTEGFYFEIKRSLVYELKVDERKIWRLDEFVWKLACEAKK